MKICPFLILGYFKCRSSWPFCLTNHCCISILNRARKRSLKTTKNNTSSVNKNPSSNISIPGFNKNSSITDQINQALSLTGSDKINAELQIAHELNIDTSSMTQDNLESTLRDYAQSHSSNKQNPLEYSHN